MPISVARAIAYGALLRVEVGGAYASDLLHAQLGRIDNPNDAALAMEITMGTLRWQRLLDFFIERYSTKSIRLLDSEVLVALRMGIYQLRHMTRIPARAAVNESVELVKGSQKKSASPFVNAVLRRAARESDQKTEKFSPPTAGPADSVALANSHPTWLVERWRERFGHHEALALLKENNRVPNRAAWLDPEYRGDTLRSLADGAVEWEPGQLSRDAILIRHGDASRTRPFQKGWIAFQDEASQMIPLLAGVKRGESVLDLCAAPGGKTRTLARAAGPDALIIATDRHENRLRAMSGRLKNAGRVMLAAIDGTAPLPFSVQFDRILVDAPCSGTGTLARNPEIRWRLQPDDLAALHRRQVGLLRSAIAYLKAGGQLVYSTCSLEPEENEDVVNDILEANPEFQTVPVEIPFDCLQAGVRTEELIDSEGAFRTFPPQHHTDGFFAVALKRR